MGNDEHAIDGWIIFDPIRQPCFVVRNAIDDSDQIVFAIEGYIDKLIGPSGGSFKLISAEGERDVKYKESDWVTYYVDMADHLLRGAPIPVSGEDGRRVITVLETAEISSRNGHSEQPPYA